MTANPHQTPTPPWVYPGSAYPPPPPPLPPKRPSRFSTRAVAVVAGATLVAGALGGGVGALLAGDDSTTPVTTSALPTSSTEKTDVSAIVDKVAASVVQLTGQVRQGTILGSGVILSPDGRILTNNHVVDGADNLTVTLADGKKVNASVVSTDPAHDLAVVQAEGVSGLTPATFADSDSVRVGDEVIAIGSPLGLQNTVTTGIVSALGREVTASNEDEQQRTPFPMADNDSSEVSYKAIQTDASINQGNSGGPLFNTNGEVIGINSAMYSPVTGPDGSAGSVGIGFAIPSNTAKELIDQS
jgi:putative serine protease PepD